MLEHVLEGCQCEGKRCTKCWNRFLAHAVKREQVLSSSAGFSIAVFLLSRKNTALSFVDVSVLARAHRPMIGTGREAGRAGPWSLPCTLDTEKRARVGSWHARANANRASAERHTTRVPTAYA